MVALGRQISTHRGHIAHPWREARTFAHVPSVLIGLMFSVKVFLEPSRSMLVNLAFPICLTAAIWVLLYATFGTIRPLERWRQKVVLFELGMVGQSHLGFRRIFLWTEIERVELVHSNYWFLVASRRAKPRTLWIPWQVREPRRFAEEVAILAGESNPLTEELRRRTFGLGDSQAGESKVSR
jgi:hypothetical protein